MHQILKYPRYRKLAESERRWSLSPALEETYELLDDLYSEYLGNFGSPWLNANCDEPVDLGKGLSKSRAETEGVAAIFAAHVARVQDLAAKHGKKTMIWADFIFELRSPLPSPKGLPSSTGGTRRTTTSRRRRCARTAFLFMAAGRRDGTLSSPPRERARQRPRIRRGQTPRRWAPGDEWGRGPGLSKLDPASLGRRPPGARSRTRKLSIGLSPCLFSDPSEAVARFTAGFDHFNHSP
jgi:hypothetical protein